jgi:hypothetical protein
MLPQSARFPWRVCAATLMPLAALLLIVGMIRSTVAQAASGFEARRLRATESGASVGYYPNCRFGVGGNVDGYDVAALNVGWHMDWSAHLSPAHPNGADYLQVIRLKPDLNSGYTFTPTTATLHLVIDQNPGATWLIGNEPDSPWQDNLLPEDYAQAYHHVYDLIKQRDPTAQIGAGGAVQPTPLRFQYLDRVLNAYWQLYGKRLPADLWNIHTYILREIDPSDPEAQPNGPYEVWGAFIPPGITATRGILYTYSDMFSTAIFRQRLIDFRAWMRDRGYRDTPLYITEHGELFPYPPYITPPPYQDEHGVNITEDRVAAYMTRTFDILLNLTDAEAGYPADDNRLVQRWLWYSVSDPNFGGLLFDPTTRERRPLGDVFYTTTHAISPGVDLLAVRVVAEPAAILYAGQPETTTLKATISNIGNIAMTAPMTVAFYAGTPPAGTPIGSPRLITPVLEGCAGTVEVSTTWSNLGAGAHPLYVEVSPGAGVIEVRDDNNVAAGFALVATEHVYLPAITKAHPGDP